MYNWRLQQLRDQLHRRFPLLGGWLQRRAARQLAQDHSPPALALLAEAGLSHPNPEVQHIARQAIERTKSAAGIDAVCKTWLQTRHPWLGEQIRKHGWVAQRPAQLRVFSALQAGKLAEIYPGDAKWVPILVEACHDTDRHIAQAAQGTLAGSLKPSGVNALCTIWAEDRLPLLESIIQEKGYVAQRPPAARVLSALKVGKPEAITRSGGHIVPPLVQAVEDRDAQIATAARQALLELSDTSAQDAVCRLVIEQNDPVAQQAALQAGYLPRDATQKAIFLFLTSQLEAYQALDFDQRMLRAAYEAGEAGLRQRILEGVRLSGQIEYLNAIASRTITVLDAGEADRLVNLLAEHGDWPRLWAKIFEMPFPSSLRALRLPAMQTWQPPEGESPAWSELTGLARGEVETDLAVLAAQVPPAVRCARAHLRSGRINDLAFAPNRPLIAVCTSARKVAMWDFQAGERHELLSGFDHSLGEVTYTPSGHLVFAERSNTDEICTTYVYDGNQVRRAWQQRGSVTAMEPVGKSQVLIAGRGQSLTLLDVENPRAVSGPAGLTFWPRAMRVAPDGSRVALLHYGVEMSRLPDLLALSPIGGSFSLKGVLRCAAFSPDGKAIAIGAFNGQVAALPMDTSDGDIRLLYKHGERVEGIESLPGRSLLVSAAADREVYFTGWANPAMPGKIRTPGEGLTSLHISPDGDFMALGDSDASLTLWDLRPLDIPALLARPLAHSTPNHLAALRLLLEEQGFSPGVRQAFTLLERLLRYRFRYEIEVSEMTGIKAGEYEIEIE